MARIAPEDIGLENLKMPENLANLVFYNPDGVDFAQKIERCDRTHSGGTTARRTQ